VPPELRDRIVVAMCPNCATQTSFERGFGGGEFGVISLPTDLERDGMSNATLHYRLHRCAGCGRGALAKIYDTTRNDGTHALTLAEFFPQAVNPAAIPLSTPSDIQSELREAELCASVSAWRGASALLRSCLEKTLKVNGYTKASDPKFRNLNSLIDAAAADGILTETRRKRAHEEVRSLGNDILHEEWRVVTPEEFEIAHHYVQRILEDFYDDRPLVEATLISKNRLQATASPPVAPSTTAVP
jgi:hypothetical protein